MREELEFHVENYASDLERAGIPRETAMRRARAELGSLAAGTDKCRTSWGTRRFDELWGDVRYALRMLRKSPGFAAIAIGSLALGIGANTVIYTAAQHMLLDRLAVTHPDQLRMLEWTQPNQNGVVEESWGWFDEGPNGAELSTSFSYPVYEQLRKANRSMEELFAFKPLNRTTVSVKGHAEALDAEMVSGNYFSSLGRAAELGRVIDESDDGAPGSGPVAMISDRLWTSHFGRAQDVIGKTVLVNTIPLTIVGVVPRDFTGAFSAQGKPDVWFPFSMQPMVAPPDWGGDAANLLTNTKLWWVLVMGRAKAGVPDSKAAAELNVTMDAAIRATMTPHGRAMARLLLIDGSRGQDPSAELSKPIYVLLGLAGFVLLLACANLANLLLARGAARQREMSVRLAMGAVRGRILRQVMTENLMLSLFGGAMGLLLAYAVRNAIPRMLSNAWAAPAFAARFDWRIFFFAFLVSIATGIVFGLGPAWAATKADVSTGLKDMAQTTTHRRRGTAGRAIVVVQVALSMVLVVGAGLFVQTLFRLGHARLGLNPDRITLFFVFPPQAKYPSAATIPLYRAIEQKLQAIPGVEHAAVTRLPLIAGNVSRHFFVPEGTARKPNGQNPSVLTNQVGRDFFATYQIPILAGRGFDATDTESSRRVAVVNEALAKKYFPNANPIGKTFDDNYDKPDQVVIVGVCGDTKYARVQMGMDPQYFTPYFQLQNGSGAVTFVMKTRMDRAGLASAIHSVVASMDPNLPVLDVRTQNEQIMATMRNERIFANLTAGFGVLALVLAAIGIYGILAYSVSRRTNEIGIRMALGAEPRRVLGMVMREAVWIVIIGVAAGLGGALALGRVVATMLYGLKAWDPATLTAAAGLLATVALAASWIPARRAARVDPMQALRHE